MCAIYKKELRAYLTSMTGYIFMAVLLAVTSLYYVANCLVGGYPVFGAVLSSVYFVLLIIVPVLTMRSMAEEKRQKTDQLLMTAPVSLWKIVLGKYLAMVTIFLFLFVATWNNFLLPLMMVSSDTLKPVTLGLYGMVSLATFTDRGALMMGALLGVLPVIVLFLGLQRYWQSGLAAGAVKG